jgi:hypothetical protein
MIMIVNLKSQTDLGGFYIVYEGSTNLEKSGWYGISSSYGTFNVEEL